MITEEGWKKLCETYPAFKDYGSKFPELPHEKIAFEDLKEKLTQPEKGAWEIPEGEFKPLALISKDEFS